MAASDDVSVVEAPACINVGMWHVELVIWPLLVGDDTLLDQGDIAEHLGVYRTKVTHNLKKLVEVGSIKPGVSGRRGHFQRGNSIVLVRARSDSTKVLYEGSVDAYLAQGHGPADVNPDAEDVTKLDSPVGEDQGAPDVDAADEPDEDEPLFASDHEDCPDSVRSVIKPDQIVHSISRWGSEKCAWVECCMRISASSTSMSIFQR